MLGLYIFLSPKNCQDFSHQTCPSMKSEYYHDPTESTKHHPC